MKKSFTGLIAAPHTPLRSDGSLATETIPRQARLLASNGVVGAFVCGTTGEGYSLTSEERRRVVEAWIAARSGPLAVIVHVGNLCLAEACEHARQAQEAGADAIATIAPSFFKPRGAEELVAWCAQVAAAAPAVPFYYYHMPGFTGLNIRVSEFLNLAHGRIPTLAGVKFTEDNTMGFHDAMKAAAGRYELLFGCDEVLLSGLTCGARGAVGSTYNYAAPLYHRILAAFARGDIRSACTDQARAMEMVTVLNRHGGLPAGKAIMKLIGLDCGPVRLPLRALTPTNEAQLRADLDAIGFFEYCSRLP